MAALPTAALAESTDRVVLAQGTFGTAVAFILAVTVLKLTALVLGYMIVRLGHDTLIKGVSGKIDFGFKAGTVDAKLKSATPGAFFILAGGAIIAWALFVQKPMEISFDAAAPAATTAASAATDDAPEAPVPLMPAHRPELPK